MIVREDRPFLSKRIWPDAMLIKLQRMKKGQTVDPITLGEESDSDGIKVARQRCEVPRLCPLIGP